jgi:UDP-N-acetylmuramoylalanine--D-glutamate ligase
VTLGKDGSKVAAVANACGIAHVEVASIESAVLEAVKGVAKGDLVLLSPACSSLDMYDSFQQRGDIFASSVRSLTAADLLELQT